MCQCQRIVHFIHTRFYNTDYVKLLQARHDAGRRYITFRRDDGNFAALLRAQRLGQPFTKDDVKPARFQIIEAARRHIVTVIHHVFFFVRQNTAYLHAAHFAGVRQQCLIRNIRRTGQYFFFPLHELPQVLPVFTAAIVVITDFRMRRHIQKLAADFLLKTVHHRQHHNQRHHAQCDAGYRHHGDKRHETVALFRPQITQADPSFQRSHFYQSCLMNEK